MRRAEGEEGQVIVLVALTAAVLIGFIAMVLTFGTWFQNQRQLQAIVDAGALAGAQDLPAVSANSTDAQAQATAQAFATQNASDNPASNTTLAVTFPAPTGSGCTTSNCIVVQGSRHATGFLTAVLSALGTTATKAQAQAFVGPPSAANDVLAAAIDVTQFDADTHCPSACHYGADHTVSFDASNGLTLLDLTSGSQTPQAGGTVPTSTLCQWLQTGFTGSLSAPQWFGLDSGAKNGVHNCFNDDGTTVNLVPIYDQANSSPAAVHVIGFAAFVIDQGGVVSWTGPTNGSGSHELQGKFVQFFATGIAGGPGGTNFGVFVVGLDG